jgi:iron complex outermembrane receptor protein
MSRQVFPSRVAVLTAAALLAMSTLGATHASAQTATPGAAPKPLPAATAASAPPADEAVTLQQVIVHARGRDETEQSVPMSVKAFSAKDIQDAGISRPADFVALSPNLSLSESQSVGTSFMTIRGLSQVRNGEAPMAVVVDGVVQSDARQFTQDLFDIQSIEVLRGPQGALYGRNASGGAILIQTKQPTNETTGYGQLTLGNGGDKEVQGAISGALVKDQVFFRLAGSLTDRDGYFENDYLHIKADSYRDHTIRGLLKWNVSDALTLDLRTNFVRDVGGGDNFQYQPTHLNADCTADQNNLFDFSRLDANTVSRTFCANNPGRNTRNMDEITLKADYELPFATLSGTVSHNKLTEYLASDQLPYSASLDGTQTQWVDTKSNSVEVRLTSPTQAGIRWMAGVYALKTDHFISTSTGEDLGHGIDYLTDDPAFNSSTNPTQTWFADRDHNLATAAFGNIDYDVTRQIEASFALRYDRDHREQFVDTRQLSGLPPGCSPTDLAACEKTATYSALQPKVSLRYKMADASLLYASAGEGFRSGEFNQSGVGAAAAAANPPVVGVADQIGAEITRSLEVGYKTTLFGGRVQLNSALFRTEVTNAPYFVFVGAAGAQILVPIDRVALFGGELEMAANVAPGLDLSAGVGLTHSKVERYGLNPQDVGKQAPYVPNASGDLGAQYRFGVGSGMRLVTRADVIFKGKQYWDPENSTPRSALTLLNLRFALEDSGGKWSAALSVNNATDKAYNAEWVSGGFSAPALPRVIRLDLRYNY